MAYPHIKLFFFAKRLSTLEEVKESLNQYSLDDIQLFIQEKVFDPELYEALEDYFLERFKQRV